MPLTVGGGIRTLEDIRRLLSAGCDKVSINSTAVKDPEFVRQAALRFGSQCIVVNIDPKRVETIADCELRIADSAGKSKSLPEHLQVRPRPAPATFNSRSSTVYWDVHINGGRIPTGLDAVAWAEEVERLGAGEIVLTSMDADGTKDGYDLEITRAVCDAVQIPVVASGGAGSPEHMFEVLTAGNADAALAASIFHYGEYTIEETKRFLAERAVPVRIDAACF